MTDFAPAPRDFEDAWKLAREAHPDVDLGIDVFEHHLARHGIDATSLATTRTADLYLALGCGLGNEAALRRFERDHLREVPAFVAHLGLSSDAIDELLQALRARLLAPRADGAKILFYSGKGPLGGWLRVGAVRLALTHAARNPRTEQDDNAVAVASAGADPELLLARLHAGQAFKAAFEASLAAAPADERTVLRMHYVDGLTIDQIGVAYAVHRATAARWLAAGRERVANLTRKHLRESLKLDNRDLESILRLVDSHLDLSLHRVLGGAVAIDE